MGNEVDFQGFVCGSCSCAENTGVWQLGTTRVVCPQCRGQRQVPHLSEWRKTQANDPRQVQGKETLRSMERRCKRVDDWARERSRVKHLGDELSPSLESDSLMDEDESWRRGTERMEQHSIDWAQKSLESCFSSWLSCGSLSTWHPSSQCPWGQQSWERERGILAAAHVLLKVHWVQLHRTIEAAWRTLTVLNIASFWHEGRQSGWAGSRCKAPASAFVLPRCLSHKSTWRPGKRGGWRDYVWLIWGQLPVSRSVRWERRRGYQRDVSASDY